MKLRQTELSGHLVRQLAPLYILSGAETLIVAELIDQIKQKAKQEGYNETPAIEIGSSFDWLELRQNLWQQSLFASKEIVVLRLLSEKINSEAQNFFKELSQKLPSAKLVIIQLGKLETAQTNSVWFKTIEAKSIFIQCWPLQGAALLQWAKQKLAQKNLSLDKEAWALLMEQSENNLFFLQQTIEKLSLTFPNSKMISLKELSELIFQNSQYSLFDFADTILSQNTEKTVKIYQILLAEETELILILWVLTRELRNLFQIVYLRESGLALPAIYKKLLIWEKRQPLYHKALGALKKDDIVMMLELSSRIDVWIKSGQALEAKRVLLHVALAMAGEKKLLSMDMKYDNP